MSGKSVVAAAVAAFLFANAAQASESRLWVVYFDRDSQVTTDARAVIAAAADYKTTSCPERLILVAHTDTYGTASDNLSRSAQYGQAVADELIRHGVPAEQVSIRAMGETQPAVQTGDNVDEPLNRRVEIWFGENDERRSCPW